MKKTTPDSYTVTPDYFYDSVSKKVGLPREVVKDIYTKYLQRVSDVCRVDNKVMLKNLGSFELDPNKALYRLWSFAGYVQKYPTLYTEEYETPRNIGILKETCRIYKDLLKIKKKYEYIERSLEKLRQDSGRFEELIDHKGNCRRSFESKVTHMQKLSVQFGECEDISGV